MLTERQRHDAYEAMEGAFGDQTDMVIAMLRIDHDQLATKDDLALTRSDLRTEMADLRTDLRTEMAGLRVDLGAEIRDAFQAQTRYMILALVSAVTLMIISNAMTTILG